MRGGDVNTSISGESFIRWMVVNGVGGALAGLLVALVYNAVAGMMGGIKLELE